ncbi:hypothetical protein BRPE64_ECDS03010 (plasmid) [Caballeronia insecticola]|uniref:Uncharacterized protein n=1 Tax=Caballeronia insecticola TaxID=758793 RepID=A0A060PJT6_9BURK|nr:hypothetical protein BRPE64_ECDS03010 [Caballeronia insecticola]
MLGSRSISRTLKRWSKRRDRERLAWEIDNSGGMSVTDNHGENTQTEIAAVTSQTTVPATRQRLLDVFDRREG